MKKDEDKKERIYKNRCEGWVRIGGLMTFGLPEWKQCANEGIVFIKFKENNRIRTLPACAKCWNLLKKQEIEDKKIRVIDVSPILSETVTRKTVLEPEKEVKSDGLFDG